MKRPFTAWLFLRIRAYHSDIAETPFASVQDLNSNDRKYAYVVWKLSDDGKHLTLRGVNRIVIPKEKKDSTGIAKFLEENSKNPCLLVDRFAAECDGKIERKMRS